MTAPWFGDGAGVVPGGRICYGRGRSCARPLPSREER
jgi:hypothetical protein